VIVVGVSFKVLGKFFNAGGQQGNLHFRASGIVAATAVPRHDLLFLLTGQRHY
jgi:hypothetical protein